MGLGQAGWAGCPVRAATADHAEARDRAGPPAADRRRIAATSGRPSRLRPSRTARGGGNGPDGCAAAAVPASRGTAIWDPRYREPGYTLRMSESQPSGRAVSRPGAEMPILAPFGRRPSASDFAFDSLRRAILDLALPPGTLLSRPGLAARLGVSQTPVREALIRLQAEGLVEVVPNASTRVARIQVESAREAHVLRLALEVEVVRRLAEAGDPALAGTLRGLLAEQEALLGRGDHAGFAAADEAFHAALHEAAGIPALWDLVRSRSGHLDRLRRLHLPAPGKAATILQEHHRLAQALAGRDAAGAERILRAHLSGTFARIEAIRAEFPAYF